MLKHVWGKTTRGPKQTSMNLVAPVCHASLYICRPSSRGRATSTPGRNPLLRTTHTTQECYNIGGLCRTETKANTKTQLWNLSPALSISFCNTLRNRMFKKPEKGDVQATYPEGCQQNTHVRRNAHQTHFHCGSTSSLKGGGKLLEEPASCLPRASCQPCWATWSQTACRSPGVAAAWRSVCPPAGQHCVLPAPARAKTG